MRNGVQRRAGRERQRFRCKGDASQGIKQHTFLGAASHTRTEPGFCEECDNLVAAHEGPVSPWHFEYLVREVAQSLVAVGRGLSYTDAAKRARASANLHRRDNDKEVTNGQTVAEWMADFVPVVAARYRETEWPETLVLDSTEFDWTNPRTGTTKQLFAVLGAWGYPAGDSRGHLWRLAAAPRDNAASWEEFLSALPGKPASVVCDRDLAIIAGVQRRWGKGKNAVPIHLCEHHLFVRGVAAMERDGLGFYHPLRDLFCTAFHSQPEWDAFDAAVMAEPGALATQRWVRHWRTRMRLQTKRRSSLPAHYANGAIEPPIAIVRSVLESRRWTFRNRERMDLLLELVRLRVRRLDSERAYARAIREHLEATGGQGPRRYRQLYDPWGPRGAQVRSYSLWG